MIAAASAIRRFLEDSIGAEAAALAGELCSDPELDALRPSGLNGDGSAIQLVWPSGGDGVRLLVDPGAFGSMRSRWEQTQMAFDALARMTAQPQLASVLRGVVDALCVDDDQGFPDGYAWVGAPIARTGFCAYIDARSGGDAEQAWSKLGQYLSATLADAAPACQTIDRLASAVEIQSVGIEGTQADRAVVKVYWRVPDLAALSLVTADDSTARDIMRFLETAMGDNAMRVSGLVLSTGFVIATGEPAGIKVDLCACPACLHLGSDGWRERLDVLCWVFGWAPLPARALHPGAEVAFIGMGRSLDGTTRLNLYTKPISAGESPTAESRAVPTA
ncbi:MAG TPA: hypothetical protein VGP41_04810 [Candidatus Lustribacter sp.]|jgi:hypothetical protein|nr:hypothetical protein [Candidatus Lustribacter sp.]